MIGFSFRTSILLDYSYNTNMSTKNETLISVQIISDLRRSG